MLISADRGPLQGRAAGLARRRELQGYSDGVRSSWSARARSKSRPVPSSARERGCTETWVGSGAISGSAGSTVRRHLHGGRRRHIRPRSPPDRPVPAPPAPCPASRRCLPTAGFAVAGLLRLALVAPAVPPIADLRRHAARQAAGPDQFEGQEQSPSVVAVHDRVRDQVAGHRGGVEAVATETARQPNTRRQFPDLRHAVDGAAEHTGPEVLDRDLA